MKKTIMILLLLTLSGCGTIAALQSKNQHISPEYKFYNLPHVYCGTIFDIFTQFGPRIDKQGGADTLGAIFFYDIPLSFVADTLILPYTCMEQITYGNIWDMEKTKNN